MNIEGLALNLSSTTITVIVIIAIVLYTWLTRDQEVVDDKED
ncbi:hypothetical protein [Candidatus Nitrotoga fabula]|nr:hypothetical protein [Candidatus Nitrotoga fabula]